MHALNHVFKGRSTVSFDSVLFLFCSANFLYATMKKMNLNSFVSSINRKSRCSFRATFFFFQFLDQLRCFFLKLISINTLFPNDYHKPVIYLTTIRLARTRIPIDHHPSDILLWFGLLPCNFPCARQQQQLQLHQRHHALSNELAAAIPFTYTCAFQPNYD
jgi:hypothetical protein